MALTVNTLTNLMPTLYKAFNVVSREMVGFMPAVTLDASAERYAVNQVIRSTEVGAQTPEDGAATMTLPNPSGQTIGNKTLQITKDRSVLIPITGEEIAQLANGGPGINVVKQNFIQESIRSLVNEMEEFIGALSIYASRAGIINDTTLFKTDLKDLISLRQILNENGANGDRQLVLSDADAAALLGLTQLTKVNEAGTPSFVRQGIFAELFGFQIRESGGVNRPAIGTSNNAGTVGTAAYAVGATTLTLASAGTGTIVDGDVITLTGDTNQYVVLTGDTNIANGGTIVLQDPGLKVAIAENASPTITVKTKGYRSMAFPRSAIVLATRLPKMPDVGPFGDAAVDAATITDPNSGISFDLRVYAGRRMIALEVAICYGAAVMKEEHLAVTLGL